MSEVIHKFELDVTGSQRILMRAPAKVLSVQVQRGLPFLWAITDTDETRLEATLSIVTVGTGHPVGEIADYQFLGTYQIHEGSFVGHVFWRRIK